MSLLFTFSHCLLNANAGYEVRGLVMADDYAKEFEKTAFPTSPPTFSGTSGCRCLSRKLFALHLQKNNCRGSEIWMISYVVKVLYLPYYMASNYWENAIFWGEKILHQIAA